MSVQMTDVHSCSYYCDRPECIKAQRDELRERLAQPEQDVPVGWLESPDGAFRANPLYKIKFPSKLLSWQVPLFITPPQRLPLTDGELADLWYKQSLDWLEFGRAVQAAHGIKENT
jgi:hypothetical protein